MLRHTSGTIYIPSVTGNVVITAVAREPIQSTYYTATLTDNVLTLAINGDETVLETSESGDIMTAMVDF